LTKEKNQKRETRKKKDFTRELDNKIKCKSIFALQSYIISLGNKRGKTKIQQSTTRLGVISVLLCT
jgi:hypothetical protein